MQVLMWPIPVISSCSASQVTAHIHNVTVRDCEWARRSNWHECLRNGDMNHLTCSGSFVFSLLLFFGNFLVEISSFQQIAKKKNISGLKRRKVECVWPEWFCLDVMQTSTMKTSQCLSSQTPGELLYPDGFGDQTLNFLVNFCPIRRVDRVEWLIDPKFKRCGCNFEQDFCFHGYQ